MRGLHNAIQSKFWILCRSSNGTLVEKHFIDIIFLKAFSRQTFVEKHFVDRTFCWNIISMLLMFSHCRKGLPRLIFFKDLLGLFKPADLSIDRIYYILAVSKENHSLQRSAGPHPKCRSCPHAQLRTSLQPNCFR